MGGEIIKGGVNWRGLYLLLERAGDVQAGGVGPQMQKGGWLLGGWVGGCWGGWLLGWFFEWLGGWLGG